MWVGICSVTALIMYSYEGGARGVRKPFKCHRDRVSIPGHLQSSQFRAPFRFCCVCRAMLVTRYNPIVNECHSFADDRFILQNAVSVSRHQRIARRMWLEITTASMLHQRWHFILESWVKKNSKKEMKKKTSETKKEDYKAELWKICMNHWFVNRDRDAACLLLNIWWSEPNWL